MNTHHKHKIATSLLLGSVLSMAQTPIMAAPGLTLQVSQTPLSVAAASVAPNIMLMIDNSGSMSSQFTVPSIVPSNMPSSFTYTCNSPVAGGASSSSAAIASPSIVMRDNNTSPAFCKPSTTCGTTSQQTVFGNGTGQQCFNNSQYYTISYYNGVAATVSGVYSGLQFNWYFSQNTFAGSLQPSNGAFTTWTRIEMATQAATDLVNSLVPATGEPVKVRLGLATYYNGSQGQLLVPISDLTTTQATKITNITNQNSSGVNGFWSSSGSITSSNYWTSGGWNNTVVPGSGSSTPLAMTLSDIGRYFVTGTSTTDTNQLTLHPNTTKSSTDTVDHILGTSSNSVRLIKNSTGITSLASPIQNYCQKNAVILISDGVPNSDSSVSSDIRNYTGDCGFTNGTTADNDNTASYSATTNPNTCDSTPNGSPGFPAGATTPITLAQSKSGQNGSKVGRAYESGGSDYLDDVAAALYDMDLRPDLSSSVGKHNISTYTIGIADPAVLAQVRPINGGSGTAVGTVLEDAAIHGGGQFVFAADYVALSNALNTMVASIRKGIGSFSALASNSTQLNTNSALFQATYDVSDWTGDFYAWQLGTGTNGAALGAIFSTSAWDAGNFIVKPVTATVGLTSAQATAQATAPTWANRNIFTYNPTNKGISLKGLTFATGTGSAFTTCGLLSAAQQTALGINSCSSTTDQGLWRLDYLRGDTSREVINGTQTYTTDTRTSAGIFRNRVRFRTTAGTGYNIGDVWQDPWLLGDIVNSGPAYVGTTEDYGYATLSGMATENTASSYKTFVTGKSTWTPMVYVGANDGFLHGFNANVDPAQSGGSEVFAYMPYSAFDPDNGLINLSSPSYSHQYFVDGSPKTGDVYFGSAWHTVLVGTTGAGGKGVFALDITNPSAFSSSKILWDINDSSALIASNVTDSNITAGVQTASPFSGFAKDMGYTLPQPSIGKMNNGKWAAIVANGYASANGKAVLYILDIQTGAIIATFNTDTGGTGSQPASPDPASKSVLGGSTAAVNGLSTPFAADINSDGIIDVIYAGDLLGNMWKFDVSSTDPTKWQIAYKTASGSPSPLFVACDYTYASTVASCARQPITDRPQVGVVGTTGTYAQKTGLMVYFGTGEYFQDSDNNVTNTQTQTFYGLWDNCPLVNTALYGSGSAPATCTATTAAVSMTLPIPTPKRAATPPATDPSTLGTSGLVQQSIQGETTTSPYVRVGSSLTVNYPSQQGWYIDFYDVNAASDGTSPLLTPLAANNRGERIVSASLLRGGNIVFVTLIPIPSVTSDPCTPGSHSTSWLTELNALTGAAPTTATLNILGTNAMPSSSNAYVTLTINGKSVTVPASSVKMQNGSTTTPAILSSPGNPDFKFTGSSEGSTPGSTAETPASTSTPPNGASAAAAGSGRLSWQQLR